MSASIYFRIVKPPEGQLKVRTPSWFVESMTRAFGPAPWRLRAEHVPKLEGMGAVYDGDRQDKPFEEIVRRIQADDGTTCEIEVWPEY